MKQLLSFLILILLLSSCSNEASDDSFLFEEAELVYLDSVLIEDENSQLGFVLNEKLYQDSILVLGDGSFSSISVFNTRKGSLIGVFNTSTITDYPLTAGNYSNAFVSGDTLFMLNGLTKEIFAFDFKKNFLEKIKLKIPSDKFVLDFVGLFQKLDNQWIVSTKVDGTLSEVFQKSKLVSVFDSEGNYKRSFGEYPKSYTDEPLVLTKNNNELVKGGKIYLLNGAGIPILKEFDLQGKLLREIEIKSEFFNPTIGYYREDPFEAPPTDQFTNIAADLNSDKDIFYVTYFRFLSREQRDALTSYRYMLMKFDLDRKVISETELLGAEYISGIHELLPTVHGDTLQLLVREQDENLYIKRFTFK
jgi:hypothetical protein